MKIMDQTAFEAQNVFGLGAPNDAYASTLPASPSSASDKAGGRSVSGQCHLRAGLPEQLAHPDHGLQEAYCKM